MKRFVLILALLLSIDPAFAQHRADRQHLSDPHSSTMILLGDPQGYIKYDLNQPLMDLQMSWIYDNADHLNMKAVLCVGDLVEQNDNDILNRNMLNQTSVQMWEAVSEAFKWIDGKIPHLHSPGNHDYGFRNAENEHTYFPDYFAADRQGKVLQDCLVSQIPNREGRESLENAAFEFKLHGWDRKILVLTSEFAPSDSAVKWAKDLCMSEEYKDHIVIYMTHSYMRCHKKCGNSLISQEKYNLSKEESNNSGEQLWEKLISKVPNIRLVLCGHHAHGPDAQTGKDVYENNVGWRVDKNDCGHDVHQMMFNVQTLGGGWEGNGGDCWLRILEFLPDGKTVKVSTYSPLFGISPQTRHLSHRTGTLDRFDFQID